MAPGSFYRSIPSVGEAGGNLTMALIIQLKVDLSTIELLIG